MSVRYVLQEIPFEWDRGKAAANREKHGIDFELACEAFFDPFVRVLDRRHEASEVRQAVLGMTAGWRLLFVVFVEHGDVIRLISAREATSAERRQYEDP